MPQPQDLKEEVSPLVMPTDQYLLNLFTHGFRETPKNAAAQLDDVSSSYAANRLRALKFRGYMHQPGPADNSGMYQITNWGRIAAAHIDQYSRPYDDAFHSLVLRVAAHDTSADMEGGCGRRPPEPDPYNDTQTDWVQLIPDEIDALRALSKVSGITIPSEFRKQFPDVAGSDDTAETVNTPEAADLLFRLFFFGFAERPQEMDAYRLSLVGEAAAKLDSDELQSGLLLDQLTD